jgi:putative transcriptional regulator
MAGTPIHNNIRKLRFEHGEMTQKQLADHVGVTRQTIVAIENAKYSPSLELAFRIAHVFEVPLTDVFIYDAYDAEADTKETKK